MRLCPCLYMNFFKSSVYLSVNIRVDLKRNPSSYCESILFSIFLELFKWHILVIVNSKRTFCFFQSGQNGQSKIKTNKLNCFDKLKILTIRFISIYGIWLHSWNLKSKIVAYHFVLPTTLMLLGLLLFIDFNQKNNNNRLKSFFMRLTNLLRCRSGLLKNFNCLFFIECDREKKSIEMRQNKRETVIFFTSFFGESNGL